MSSTRASDVRSARPADPVLAAISGGVTCFDLARPYVVGMPQSPNHPAYQHVLPRRHGDKVRGDGGSAANDLIVMGTHVGTHMDAIAHVSHDGKLFGGIDARQAQVGGRFEVHGIDSVAPRIGRGVLLDIPAALGLDACPPAYEITPDDLGKATAQHDLHVDPGDALLIRSGWGRHWDEPATYVGHATGVPGVGPAGAEWLISHSPGVVGADTIAFEHLPAGRGHALLPVHRMLLVEAGVNIIETMNLEELARAGVYEFTLVLAPLPLVGATASPIRPLAIVADGGQG